jgi:hypothetical protein
MLRPVGTKLFTTSTPKSRGFDSTDLATYRITWIVKAHVTAMVNGKERLVEQIECVSTEERPTEPQETNYICSVCGSKLMVDPEDDGLFCRKGCFFEPPSGKMEP